MGQLTRATTLPTSPAPTAPTAPTRPEPLWRELTGRVLRRHRHERGERLTETAERAGVSTQYLSEVERGRKDPSSEILAAVAGALDLTLLDLAAEVARDLRHLADPAPTGPTPTGPRPLPVAAPRPVGGPATGTDARAHAPLALVA
ncbi:DNA-binding XRE family transcriptional regulator [Nocardioides zeae]|uniref:DNA-binding XRE family transcriptional regulator n=1 Tax=Nocardioides zeae TaxID=1457234 RepID=A0ACC6IHS6_9ACTN|nr:helix-turn-helix transcriptional regulator [Nocardioides zeae]MDR6176093.1 DNA-binding XRE family transcriptional regulator [Nocardioides zeae]MDR6210239.1 DNA-binding XRE family transcriptional regulator [Nocardioides zeae]